MPWSTLEKLVVSPSISRFFVELSRTRSRSRPGCRRHCVPGAERTPAGGDFEDAQRRTDRTAPDVAVLVGFLETTR